MEVWQQKSPQKRRSADLLAPPAIRLSNQFHVDLKGLYELKPLIQDVGREFLNIGFKGNPA
jgi:hypothetical protein